MAVLPRSIGDTGGLQHEPRPRKYRSPWSHTRNSSTESSLSLIGLHAQLPEKPKKIKIVSLNYNADGCRVMRVAALPCDLHQRSW